MFKNSLAGHESRNTCLTESRLSPVSQEGGTRPCPICGAMTEQQPTGSKIRWICLTGGYAHYYQARYAHLETWFTSGKGNLREPLIQAMSHSA
jgi:hypothetical protein